MPTYRIKGMAVNEADPKLNEKLAAIYGTKERPVCICREPGVEMYVARIAGKHHIKRMPNTGSDHAPSCDSYEPPPELSGLGQVMGTAIQENAEDGITTLKFQFSLTKVAGRAAPAPSDTEKDSVKTDGNKLTLRGTLHYLWEEAGFNRWSPAMAGKRNWSVIRKYLLQAAANKMAKGANVADILYIPEPFVVARKDEISQRRIGMMMKAAAPDKGKKHLMMGIGEVKEIKPSLYGHKIRFKQADCDFMMNEDIHKRLMKRFANELELWDANDGSHLMAICTFSVSANGTPSVEEIAFMVVNENWIPIENATDKTLVDQMCNANRRFAKGLRYNLPSTKPLACLVASDTMPEPTGMYILPFGASTEYVAELETLMAESKLQTWLWKVGQADMPALPSNAAPNY